MSCGSPCRTRAWVARRRARETRRTEGGLLHPGLLLLPFETRAEPAAWILLLHKPIAIAPDYATGLCMLQPQGGRRVEQLCTTPVLAKLDALSVNSFCNYSLRPLCSRARPRKRDGGRRGPPMGLHPSLRANPLAYRLGGERSSLCCGPWW
jgi:hypothetical protein